MKKDGDLRKKQIRKSKSWTIKLWNEEKLKQIKIDLQKPDKRLQHRGFY